MNGPCLTQVGVGGSSRDFRGQGVAVPRPLVRKDCDENSILMPVVNGNWQRLDKFVSCQENGIAQI